MFGALLERSVTQNGELYLEKRLLCKPYHCASVTTVVPVLNSEKRRKSFDFLRNQRKHSVVYNPTYATAVYTKTRNAT